MHPVYLSQQAIQAFIQSSLLEDIGEGDHSSLGAIARDKKTQGRLHIKDTGVVAGIELSEWIFKFVDPTLSTTYFINDGEEIKPGDVAFVVEGNAHSILSAERLILNCMQRMSGIATYTRKLSKLLEGTAVKLMDTRKTTPNFRMMEKWAVYIGGGMNHRFALYDMIMLKDNHIALAGGIRAAIENTRKYLLQSGLNLRLEVETRTMKEVEEVMAVGGVDVIMLDNMSLEEMKTAVKRIDGKFKTEASGGIAEHNLRAVAECGVDFISMGALTHSVRSLDLSLKVDKLE